MKWLLTGGSGFIAYHLLKAKPQWQWVNLDIRKPDFEFPGKSILGSICDTEAVEKSIQGCEAIMHLAAQHHDFGISEQDYFDVNVAGTQTLIDAAKRHNIRLMVFYSSVAVYGNAGATGPTHEQTPCLPSNAYGLSKLKAEQLLMEWAAEDATRKLVIVRSTVVFGERNLANVLNLIKAIDAGIYFHVGAGNHIKSLAYVENIVEATLFAISHPEPVLLFNYVDMPQLTIRDIANMQAALLGRSIKFSLPVDLAVCLAKPFDWAIKISGKNLRISSARVKKLATQTWHGADYIRSLGFRPKHNIAYGMQKMIDWYLAAKKQE